MIRVAFYTVVGTAYNQAAQGRFWIVGVHFRRRKAEEKAARLNQLWRDFEATFHDQYEIHDVDAEESGGTEDQWRMFSGDRTMPGGTFAYGTPQYSVR